MTAHALPDRGVVLGLWMFSRGPVAGQAGIRPPVVGVDRVGGELGGAAVARRENQDRRREQGKPDSR